MRRATLCLVALALLAGCGGDDDDGGGALSREEFVRQADAVCQRTNEEGNKIQEPDAAKDFREFAENTRDVADKGVKDLKELEPPEDLKADYDKALKNLEEQVGLLDELADAAEANDAAKLQQLLARGEKLNTENRELSGRLGFKECGKDS
jgi:hypothetical protein